MSIAETTQSELSNALPGPAYDPQEGPWIPGPENVVEGGSDFDVPDANHTPAYDGDPPNVGPNPNYSEAVAKFEIGLTPLGRPAINISDGDGNKAGYTFTGPEELSGAIGHLQALLTMMIQGLYQQQFAQQQAASSLINNPAGKKLWTPN